MAAADRRRSNFTYATQNKIFDACNAECFYCHKSLVLSNRHNCERGAWNADHLIPAAKGGNNSLENGVAACWNCNSKKSDLSHVEFIAKYGGALYRVDTKIRCHGFTKNGKRCLLSAPESLNGLHYCANHLPKTHENPLLENFENLMIGAPNQGPFSSGNYFARKTYEPPADLFGNLRISRAASSPTSQKHKKFTSSQDLDNKPVKSLPGIGNILSQRLSDKGYSSTSSNSVYQKFISLNTDQQKFMTWLKNFGANSKQANDCYQCIYDWYLKNCDY